MSALDRGGSSHTAALGRSFLARRLGVVVVTTVEIYMDESGVHKGSPVVSVGASWATPEAWGEWAADWCVAKGPISVFHASDCHNREGEFKGWDRVRRDEYVKQLLPVIGRHSINGRIIGINKPALDAALAHRLDILDSIGNLYLVCLQWAIERISAVLARQRHCHAAFYHEINDYSDEALELFSYLKKKASADSILGSATFAFGGKCDFFPLQSADILAFEGFKQLQLSRKTLRKPLRAVDPTGQKMAFIVYDERNMKGFADALIQAFDARHGAAGGSS